MGLLTSNGTLRSQDKGVECGVFPVQRETGIIWKPLLKAKEDSELDSSFSTFIQNTYFVFSDLAAKNINYDSPSFLKLHRTKNIF